MSVRIALPCGRTAVVGDEDFARVAHLRWRSERIKQRAERYYAYAYIGKRKVYLHLRSAELPAGERLMPVWSPCTDSPAPFFDSICDHSVSPVWGKRHPRSQMEERA